LQKIWHATKTLDETVIGRISVYPAVMVSSMFDEEPLAKHHAPVSQRRRQSADKDPGRRKEQPHGSKRFGPEKSSALFINNGILRE